VTKHHIHDVEKNLLLAEERHRGKLVSENLQAPSQSIFQKLDAKITTAESVRYVKSAHKK
jgi:hypothetical protein